MGAKELMERQGYRFVGNHSSVKICEWTKKSLVNKGFCYKQKFYGIESHRCCQMTCFIECQNRCIHCWRPIELKLDFKKKPDDPSEIIDRCIEAQKKLIVGFKGNQGTNIKKFKEAQEPMHFALSLIGEPILYPEIGKLIIRLREMNKTSFLVTNGLEPHTLKILNKKDQLPTQLYLSLNAPNKKIYDEWHKPKVKGAWKKFNQTISLFSKLNTRRVIRMTLVRGINDQEAYIKDFAKLILRAKPDFVEVKSYMAIGFSRKRLGYSKMLSHKEIKEYSKKLVKKLESYKILDEQELSHVVLIGKSKENMKIKKA